MTKWIFAGGAVCLLAAGVWIAPRAPKLYAASHFDAAVENVKFPTPWADSSAVDVRLRNRSAFSPKLERVHVELWLRGRKLASSDWPESGSDAPLVIPSGGSATVRFKLDMASHEVWNLVRGAGYPVEVRVDAVAGLAGLRIPFRILAEKRIPHVPCCVQHKDEPQLPPERVP